MAGGGRQSGTVSFTSLSWSWAPPRLPFHHLLPFACINLWPPVPHQTQADATSCSIYSQMHLLPDASTPWCHYLHVPFSACCVEACLHECTLIVFIVASIVAISHFLWVKVLAEIDNETTLTADTYPEKATHNHLIFFMLSGEKDSFVFFLKILYSSCI